MKLDKKAIIRSVGWLFVWWVAAILAATLSGYPRAVCVTPLGWIMALSVGRRIVESSISENPNARLVEAALGGALLCLLQGLLFALIIAFGSPLSVGIGNPYDSELTALIGFGLIGGGGAVVGAALSMVAAALQLRWIKLQSDEENNDRSDPARRVIN